MTNQNKFDISRMRVSIVFLMAGLLLLCPISTNASAKSDYDTLNDVSAALERCLIAVDNILTLVQTTTTTHPASTAVTEITESSSPSTSITSTGSTETSTTSTDTTSTPSTSITSTETETETSPTDTPPNPSTSITSTETETETSPAGTTPTSTVETETYASSHGPPSTHSTSITSPDDPTTSTDSTYISEETTTPTEAPQILEGFQDTYDLSPDTLTSVSTFWGKTVEETLHEIDLVLIKIKDDPVHEEYVSDLDTLEKNLTKLYEFGHKYPSLVLKDEIMTSELIPLSNQTEQNIIETNDFVKEEADKAKRLRTVTITLSVLGAILFVAIIITITVICAKRHEKERLLNQSGSDAESIASSKAEESLSPVEQYQLPIPRIQPKPIVPMEYPVTDHPSPGVSGETQVPFEAYSGPQSSLVRNSSHLTTGSAQGPGTQNVHETRY